MVDFGVYFLVVTTLAITIDRRLARCLLANLAGAILSYLSPNNVFWFLGATHFVCGMLLAFASRPKALTGPDAQ